jgi:hypothetical protein
VELFTEEDLLTQIADLLQSYIHYHLRVDEMQDADERNDWEKRAEVARDTFRAMFRGRLGREDFLLQEPEADVRSRLESWTRELRPSHLGGRSTRSTLEACSDLLMRLTSEQSAAQEALIWPYVRKITVFLNAQILSKGLVLVDLPGYYRVFRENSANANYEQACAT